MPDTFGAVIKQDPPFSECISNVVDGLLQIAYSGVHLIIIQL